MTNEEILKAMHKRGEAGYGTAMELARQDEREKMTEQKVKDYFAGLNGKDTALVVLNYLLRGGITDDDLRGLRLQWIKDEREKMQGVDFWISWSKHYNWKENARISLKEPTVAAIGMEGAKIYNVEEPYSCLSDEICTALNISPGQCKKFRIVEDLT